jgi:vacuolar-type H+-ATPase subunit I/STV1
VAISSVIQDAVRRDQALDKFEEFLRGKLTSAADALERENAKLQAEIDELARRHREAMAQNRRRLDAERARFDAWLERKRSEEARLHEAVAPFVEANPVSRN